MRKAHVLKIAPKETKKKGNVITVQESGDLLILNCWSDKALNARYCISKTTHEYALFINDEWTQKKLCNAYGCNPRYTYYELNGYYGKKVRFNSEEEEKKLIEAFGINREHTLSGIDTIEAHYSESVREKKWRRRADRIDTEMEKIKSLPDDFFQWAKEKIFNKDYMFCEKDKKLGKCTACGKKHLIGKKKNGESFKCSNTGKTVIVKKRKKEMLQQERCMLIQRLDSETIVARHFAINMLWKDGTKQMELDEQIRYVLGEDYFKGYYGQYGVWNATPEAEITQREWWDSNGRGFRAGKCYCYPDTEALAGTKYQYLGVQQMAEKGWKVNYNNIMASYKITRGFEYLVRGGFERITREESERLSTWGYYSSNTLNLEGETLPDLLKINKQRINRLKQNNGGRNYLAWMQYEELYNRKVPEETMKFMEKENLFPENLNFILDRMRPQQIANYLKRQAGQIHESVKNTIELWKDYLSMAERLGIDTTDEIIYRANKLRQRHDELVDRINDKSDDETVTEILKDFPEADNICKEINRSGMYGNFEHNGMCIIVPNGIKDILREGRSQHHCVASSKRYFERIQLRETYIMFIRRTEEPDTSYYTLEVEPDGTVRQKRTKFDRQDKKDIGQINEFLRAWQQEVKKRITENERQLARKSKELREKEFVEMREKDLRIPGGDYAGRALADVLEADLMAV